MSAAKVRLRRERFFRNAGPGPGRTHLHRGRQDRQPGRAEQVVHRPGENIYHRASIAS